MRVLAVHSTTPILGVACVQDNGVLGEISLPPGRRHLENLPGLIEDLTARVKIRLTDFDGFGVAIGPGSFSGVRIGLATIKGMALALGKPVAGVSCLDILAEQGLEEGETGASAIDAKRGQLYVALYTRSAGSLRMLDGPMLIQRDMCKHVMGQVDFRVLVSEDAGHVNPCGDGVTIRAASPSAAVCAMLALKRLRRGDADEIHSLTPLYIRRSDAEEKKRL